MFSLQDYQFFSLPRSRTKLLTIFLFCKATNFLDPLILNDLFSQIRSNSDPPVPGFRYLLHFQCILVVTFANKLRGSRNVAVVVCILCVAVATCIEIWHWSFTGCVAKKAAADLKRDWTSVLFYSSCSRLRLWQHCSSDKVAVREIATHLYVSYPTDIFSFNSNNQNRKIFISMNTWYLSYPIEICKKVLQGSYHLLLKSGGYIHFWIFVPGAIISQEQNITLAFQICINSSKNSIF